MAEVLYLGRKKVRSINDILGTPYIGELLVCFVEGKLEKWMNEERATYLKYLDQLELLDKKLCSDTIEQIKDLFGIRQDVKIIRNQREFEKAMEDEEITNFILLGGEYYMIRGKISKKSKILVGFENNKPIIDVGYTFEKKFGDLVDCVNVDLNSVRVSTEDLVVFIQTNNLSIEEKIELINGVEITESNQELIRIKIDCLQEKGEISEAIETIEELTDEGERLFYLFDIKDRSSDNRKELIEKYLKPAVDKGNIQAIEKYVKILKDGNKAQKKEAFDILKKNASREAILLNLLGDFYLKGIGVKSDIDAAVEKYEEARRLLSSGDLEMKHSITGIGNCLMAQGKKDEAMEYYSMSSDIDMVRKVVKYYKEKGDVSQVISHFIKCKNLGDVDALLDLSNYLFTQGEAYKEQSLDYAIEYVRNADADTKKKKAVLEKRMLYYDKQEKYERDKIVCERIEREAADNGLHITRMKCKVKKTLKKVGTTVIEVGTGAGVTVLAHIICVKLDNGKEKK